jgi:biotin carboxyl carrier protein
MPGLIVKVVVQEGQAIEAGQTVVILESMKMQNELKAPITGTVGRVHIEASQTVDKNTLLLEIDAPKSEEDE